MYPGKFHVMRYFFFFISFLCLQIPLMAQPLTITVEKRFSIPVDSTRYQAKISQENWDPRQTALIICDMWDKHWCPTATARVEEMAPVMNQMVKAAREKGVFIIHAPSSVTDFYAGHPARDRAIQAPKAQNLPPDIRSWCSWLDEDERKVYPIDQSDGGCECLDCPSYDAWTRQVADIDIKAGDAISDSGEEIWNLMEARGIENVLLMGVHTNMCVLGRPFGLRNMARYGKNVVLVRDLTDTMYNPKSWPYVDHFTGTDLIIEHIEKYVCPTITSQVITGKAPFRFSADKREMTIDGEKK
jgi:nicotinamidase-related amidase